MGFLSSLFGGGSSSPRKGKKPQYIRPGPAVSAQENFRTFAGLTPWKDAAGTAATAAAGRLGTTGGSGLLTSLISRAREGLAMGGDLSPEEARAATQTGEAAAQMRGLGRSPAGILTAVLSRAAAGNARRREREAYAAGVAGLEQQQQQQDLGILTGATGSALAGNALTEDIRRFDVERGDTLTFNENTFNKDIYTGDQNAAAARSAGRANAAGSIGGGLLSFL